jgi:predicted hydrocarbon binding protein
MLGNFCNFQKLSEVNNHPKSGQPVCHAGAGASVQFLTRKRTVVECHGAKLYSGHFYGEKKY